MANDIALKSITLGEKTKVDATGLVITDGPQITTGSINAASKKVTNIAEGTRNTGAVSIFVKQDTATKHITIGKDIDGDKIDIANKSDKLRIISGVKKAERDKASMMLLIKNSLKKV
ncbi:hypothetical protein [Bartonella sp. MR110HLJHH]|uniref:hypothetical protein n=1 Tax=Bartonella sp. MR110HLJHH TaxID=3243555 RepID=UPI0035CF268E